VTVLLSVRRPGGSVLSFGGEPVLDVVTVFTTAGFESRKSESSHAPLAIRFRFLDFGSVYFVCHEIADVQAGCHREHGVISTIHDSA
jgi:hypothetical protein